LGVPTANIEMTSVNRMLTRDMVPGVYTGVCKFLNSKLPGDEFQAGKSYPCALSIGWNPTYDNPVKTVEVYIVHEFTNAQFYGEVLEVDLKSFIRAEVPFTFDVLIHSIHCDIESTIEHLEQ